MKVVVLKRCNDRWEAVSIVSNHLRSFLGAMKITIMHAYKNVLKLTIKKLHYTSKKIDLLASLKKCN